MPTATLGLCLSLLTGPQPPVFVPGERFTLAWTHSIERQRWEEDYRVELGQTPPAPAYPASPAAPDAAAGRWPEARTAGDFRLHAVQARIRGSGAGMEPPAGAVLRDGWYHYSPAQPHPGPLLLSRSGFVPDYELCVDGAPCRTLTHWLPSDGRATRLWACASTTPGAP